jgi:hypothetical protein
LMKYSKSKMTITPTKIVWSNCIYWSISENMFYILIIFARFFFDNLLSFITINISVYLQLLKHY